jgi:hypothetical protein
MVETLLLILTTPRHGGLRAGDRPAVPRVKEGETVHLPDGRGVTVLDVYDDEEHGQEGGVQATLVVDI